MSLLANTRLSVLDLAPVRQGGTIAETFDNTVTLARHAEALGYHRFWLAEHHNAAGIASAATSVLIGHVAGATSTIRVGSGGVMLPNHPPLVVAEQFGTLATLYPDRIDLGLGRAPGTDGATIAALGRNPQSGVSDFPQQVAELSRYLGDEQPGQRVSAWPGQGTHVPLWLLGSSGYSAQLAAHLGLPFAFAGQFAPGYMMEALRLYRTQFQPSEVLSEPYAMAGIPLIAADTDEEAQYQATTQQQKFLSLIRGRRIQLAPPVREMDWSPHEQAAISNNLGASIVGGPDTVRRELEAFIERTGVNEVMVNSDFFEHADRLRSYEILADIRSGRL